MITFDTDASLEWCSTSPLWHIDAVGRGVHPIINRPSMSACGQTGQAWSCESLLYCRSVIHPPTMDVATRATLRRTAVTCLTMRRRVIIDIIPKETRE